MCVCVCAYVRSLRDLHVRMYICICDVHVCVYVCDCVYMCAHVCDVWCMIVCMYVHVYTYSCEHV